MKTIKSYKYNLNQLMVKVFLLLATLYAWGCVEDVVDVNLPIVNHKMVVTSFITPNDTIRVSVTKSLPINYNISNPYVDWYHRFPQVENAVVSIRNTNSNSDETTAIPFNQNIGYYTLPPSEFSVEVGEEYELKVVDIEMNTFYARTRIPNSFPEILSLTIDTLGSHSNEYGGDETYYDLVVSGVLKDPVGEKNFYLTNVSTYQCYFDWWEDTTYCYHSTIDRSLFTDSGIDGEDISFKFNLSYVYPDEMDNMKLNILTTDDHYYNFHRSLQNNWDGDNPFAEPTPIYSNISGGLGVFSSYLMISYDLSSFQ